MKHSYIYIIGILCSLLLFSGCIDPLNEQTDTTRNILVVEGTLTTDYGPHEIRISKSAKYGSILDDQIQTITNANVFIRDSEGNQVSLSEGNSGSYFTPVDYKGEVGKTYTLVINTADGAQYLSTPEKIEPAIPIDNMEVRWKKQASVSDIQFNSGFEVYTTFTDNPATPNYYLWQAQGVYFIESRPDLHTQGGPWGPQPDPKDCCAQCYVFEFTNDLSIMADNLNNGNTITELAAYIPDNGRRFAHKYLVILEQRSLTKGAYQFYELLKEQLNIQGDIFDPPPAKIGTNVINVTSPDEDVIGYFVVSDISRDSIYVTPAEIEQKQPSNVLNDDCRVLDGATVQKPPFWIN